MKRIYLISGLPGAGKTFLANELVSRYKFKLISLDVEYVRFIKEQCPILYFQVLDKYIAPHYDAILLHRNYSLQNFQRDFVGEWHSYILTIATQQLRQEEQLVIEGYLLRDCDQLLISNLNSNANIFHIEVNNQKYLWQNNLLSLEQVAALGKK